MGNETLENAALWARVRSAPPAAGAPDGAPDEAEAALLLAAWLDGRLDAAARDRVEAWLAADPAALELMLASRADLAADPEVADAAVPESLLGRARGLVRERPAAAVAQEGPADGWLGRLFGLWQPVGVAAALLLAVLAGAELAHKSYDNLMLAEATQAEGDLGLAADELF